jgi:saccharopine dehydrogenase-like NADP-dependent oxidoreductase
MRVIVLGGTGNFGARIARALGKDPAIELLVASRRGATVPGAEPPKAVQLDIAELDFPQRLRELSPELVIHCVGPFQDQDYRVATATLDARAHYLDIADGRYFVSEFSKEMNEKAVDVGRTAITGASTLPALSFAVVQDLRQGLSSIESIEVVIAPGQRAPRGRATLEAVFSYLGRPFPVLRRGKWTQSWGWMDLRRVRLDIGARFAAACDVPDLALLPSRFLGVRTVTFHAALEFRAQHLALWGLAALRRIGLPLRVERWAVALRGLADWFDSAAGFKGGMWVSVVGERRPGDRIRRTWELTAPAVDGPEIPCMSATLLARRFARGETPASGAFVCIGFLTLADFTSEFAQWKMTTRTVEGRA